MKKFILLAFLGAIPNFASAQLISRTNALEAIQAFARVNAMRGRQERGIQNQLSAFRDAGGIITSVHVREGQTTARESQLEIRYTISERVGDRFRQTGHLFVTVSRRVIPDAGNVDRFEVEFEASTHPMGIPDRSPRGGLRVEDVVGGLNALNQAFVAAKDRDRSVSDAVGAFQKAGTLVTDFSISPNPERDGRTYALTVSEYQGMIGRTFKRGVLKINVGKQARANELSATFEEPKRGGGRSKACHLD